MNNITISGKVISEPKQVCQYKQCQNKFFKIVSDWGQIDVGLHYSLAGGISVGDTIIIKGKLSRLCIKDQNNISNFLPQDFIYVDAFFVKNTVADINDLSIDAKILTSTQICLNHAVYGLEIMLDNQPTLIYGESKNTAKFKNEVQKGKIVTVCGKLQPVLLDNNYNMEYIISVENMLQKSNDSLRGLHK